LFEPTSTRPEQTSMDRKTEALQLALLRRSTALEQRHAVVSIRLNDTEFDRLRQRAAESGISVSAYMRSCVLDAEQLRTQVKQALAEMRASLGTAQATAAVAPIALLHSERSSTVRGWTRFLWRSATFVLAPLFSLRHRG
jgi:predicted DNA binding CopG/RHH family protein